MFSRIYPDANLLIDSAADKCMNRTVPVLLISLGTVFMVSAIYLGYAVPGFVGAGIICVLVLVLTFYTRYSSIEEKIFETGLIQQYLLSNFTIDQSTLTYLQKLLQEDYHLTVTTEQLVSAIEKEQTRRELEREEEEFIDFKTKFFIGKESDTLEEFVKQFVTVFGRGSMRNVYYLKKVLDEKGVSYSDKSGFTDRIVDIKNMIEDETQRRGGPVRKETQVTITVCPTCGNEYPDVLLFCPFCERETTKVSEPVHEKFCPHCSKPMVRSILKRDNTFLKGYQCRNLKCLYEITDEESHNT
jgi:hypothetical protein